MLQSSAWRALSINARRFLDFLELDHLSHGGAENGHLRATYDQLKTYGLTRSEIFSAIEETIALGFVRRMQVHLPRVPMEYRLTYYGFISQNSMAESPTNEWESLDDRGVARVKSVLRRRLANRGARKKKQKFLNGSISRTKEAKSGETFRTNNPELGTVHFWQILEDLPLSLSSTSRTPSISRLGSREEGAHHLSGFMLGIINGGSDKAERNLA